MKTRILIFTLVLMLPVLACVSPVTITFNDDFIDKEVIRGSGDLISEERAVDDFDSVQLMIQGNLVITQGDRESLRVTADDNIMDYITTEIEGRTLVLRYDKAADDWDFRPSESYRFEIEMIEVDELEIFGMGNVSIESLETNRLSLAVYGMGDINIEDLATDRLDCAVFGMGDINVSGVASFIEVDIAGAGDVLAGDLRVDDARISIPGAGSAIVWVDGDLDVSIPGAGTVRYYGDPRIDFSSPGAGALVDLGDK